MSSNAQKFNLGQTLGQSARNKALDHIHLTGKALPASMVKKKGSIVTVKFETGPAYTLPNVTVAAYGPEYSRHPYQPGDKGFVISADSVISNMTGLGPNSPSSFTRPGNISPLVWIPVGNVNFKSVDDNKDVRYGPHGAQMADAGFNSFVGVDSAGNTLTGSTPSGTPDPTNITASTYKHTITTDNTNGVTSTSTVGVTHTAPDVTVNASTAHTINSPQTNATGNLAVADVLTAATAIFGAVAGAGGGAAPLLGGMQLSGSGAAGGATGTGTNPAWTISYQRLTPLTGTTVTLAAQYVATVIDPVGSLAALTINFPASPPDGLVQIVTFTQSISAVTCAAGTFATGVAITTVPESSTRYSFRFLFLGGLVNKWVRI